MRVDVRGPNLPNSLANRGTMHVHKEGCADLRKYPTGADQGGWVITAHTVEGLVQDIYSDFLAESDDWTWQDYLSADLYVAPCVALPMGDD